MALVPGASSGPGGLHYEYPQLMSGGEPRWACSFANLDVGLDGYVAFTYADQGLIYGRARDLRGGNVAPTPPVPFTLVQVRTTHGTRTIRLAYVGSQIR